MKALERYGWYRRIASVQTLTWWGHAGVSWGATLVAGVFGDARWMAATSLIVLAFYTAREFGDLIRKAKAGKSLVQDQQGISGIVDAHGDILGPVVVAATAVAVWWLG